MLAITPFSFDYSYNPFLLYNLLMIVNTQSTSDKTKKYQALLIVPDTFSTNFALYNYLSGILFPLKCSFLDV